MWLIMASLSSRDSAMTGACLSPPAAGGDDSGVRGLDFRIRGLRSSGELARLSKSELHSLLSYVDEVVVQAGCRVALEGELCKQYVIVTEGRLRAVSGRGESYTLGPTDSCGWAAMWERSVNEATVVAESTTRLLVVGHAQFRALKAVAGDGPPVSSGMSTH